MISGVAVFILTNSNNDKYANIKMVSLPVYGNANEDYTINQADVDLINDLIGDETKWEEHPYADADGDGKITSDDAEIVKKLINGESTKVRFIDQYVYDTGNKHLVEVDYPLCNVVTINPDMAQLTFVFDGDKKIAGWIANKDSYEKTFYKLDHNGFSKCLDTTPRTISQAGWEAIKNLDSELYSKNEGVGAVLAYNDAALGDYKDDLAAVGIPVIYIRCTDPVHCIDAAMLLGFLFGPEYNEKALNYANDCRKAIVDVTEKVGKLDDSKRTKFIALCMWNYMSQHESQYTKIGLQAGGIDVANLDGNGSDPIGDVEAITKYNGKIDYIMNCRTCDCKVVDPVTLWENSKLDILKKSTEFENMFFVNLSMPTPCRVMYVAAMFYPDIVSISDADGYFQMMVDKYLSYLNDTVSDGEFNILTDMTTICTYKDYQNAKGDGPSPESVDSYINTEALAERFFEIMGDDLNAHVAEAATVGYSYAPYSLSSENGRMESKVVSTSEQYYMKYTLTNTPKEDFERLKATYVAKVGTESRIGGICQEILNTTGLTEGYGYYVNGDKTVMGSLNFAGYKDKCVVELHIAIRPSFSLSDVNKLIDATYPSDSSVSSVAWANAVDLSLLSTYAGSPFTVVDGGTALNATIKDSENKREISFDSTSDALSLFANQKAAHIEKGATYTDANRYAEMTVSGFDDCFGYIVYRNPTTNEFFMIYFAGYKDGCFVDVTLRIDRNDYTVAEANTLLTNILSVKPA
ncbi:MAG: hypothetical protein J5673_06140 [Candidatus Methanomethylophilaceae archaeon]|nr:hypothetical protein [Candidatus Methanomethylophilaceae archaeon]